MSTKSVVPSRSGIYAQQGVKRHFLSPPAKRQPYVKPRDKTVRNGTQNHDSGRRLHSSAQEQRKTAYRGAIKARS